MVTWRPPTIIKTFKCVYCLALPKGEALAYENDEDYVATYIYHIIAGKFGESSMTCQTKTIQVSTYN